ncbi:hypothetical protein D3C84_575370 [compost metagenome]
MRHLRLEEPLTAYTRGEEALLARWVAGVVLRVNNIVLEGVVPQANSICRNATQSDACQSVNSGHGLSGKFTSTVRVPAARPQSRSKR